MMNSNRGKLLTGTIIAAIAAVPAAAQTAGSTSAPVQQGSADLDSNEAPVAPGGVADPDPDAQPTNVDDILVTGTRIIRPNLESNAPITTVDAEFLQARGLTRIEDALSQLPQITPMLGLQGTSWSSGQAKVGLRNLGPGRTLTLLNGQRADNDVGIIPGALIERIDILTGGASAVYGSDAIAGVINYIVKRRFNGIVFDGELSTFQHNNDSATMLPVLAASGYPTPSQQFIGGGNLFGSLAAGKDLFGGKVNISGFVAYKEAKPIRYRDIDTIGCPLLTNAPSSATPNANDTYACGTNTYNPYNEFYIPDTDQDLSNARDGSRTWRDWDPEADEKRVPQNDYLQRSDKTINAGGFISADLFSDIKLNTSFLYTRYRQAGTNSVNANFSGDTQINCDNPFLGAQQAQTLCGAAAGTQAFSPEVQAFLFRPNYVQTFNFGTTDWRAAAGVSGSIIGKIRFEVGYQRSRNINRYASDNIFPDDGGLSRINEGLQVRNANGVPTCLSVIDGTDPSCVPIDMFSANTAINPAVWKWLTTDASSFQQSDQEVINSVLSGTLEDYGIKSPLATNGVGFAVIAERRTNRVQSAGYGAWSNWSQYDGRTTVKDIGVEVDLPLVENVRFAKELSINGGYRVSDYDTYAKPVETWKAEATWAPVGGLRFRGSYNRAIRIGILERLEGENRYPNSYMLDLCAPPRGGGSVQRYTYEQCAVGGMTRQQYDALTDYRGCDDNGFCPTTLINGGNPDLQPERSNSYTIGLVIQPKFVPGFSATIDGYDIDISGAFEWARVGLAFTQCYRNANPYFCSLYKRDPTTGQLLEVDGRYGNSGGTRTRGVDFNVNYALDPRKLGIDATIGTFALNLNGTLTTKFERQFAPGQATWSCLGYFGFACSNPSPRWRHFAAINWAMPWIKAGVGVTWRYIGGTINSKLSSNPVLAAQPGTDFPDTYPLAERIPGMSYFDLSANVALTKRVILRFNMQNLFDRDPPLIGQDSNYSIGSYFNTFPSYYDVRGRAIKLGVRAEI